LIRWTKGFTTSGVVGVDVVALLNSALRRKQVPAEVIALANDTVGTMFARSYMDPKCEMGVILGTGTNACYIEQISNIKKIPPESSKGPSMIINTEWGGFSDGQTFLPQTKMDRSLDSSSNNPRQQTFEKMVSGMYLGEIVRYVLLDLQENGHLFSSVSTSEMSKLYEKESFLSKFVSKSLGDHSNNLDHVRSCLEEIGILTSSLKDRKIVQRACLTIITRAARLSAAAIGGVLSKIDRLHNVTVAIDGSVYEFVPGFKENMQKTLKELYPESSIELVLSKDGSGIGSAIIASTVY